MEADKKYDIGIAGGGLAGLVAAIHLQMEGFQVVLVEKKKYPFHKVCGEYLSREVLPYLDRLGVNLSGPQNARLDTFQMSSENGNSFTMPLDLGAVGISRFKLDYQLYLRAVELGVTFYFDEVTAVDREEGHFRFTLKRSPVLFSRLAIGSYGKLSRLDAYLGRSYWHSKRPFMGVKYHIKWQGNTDQVSLHNFAGGYAGLNAVEDETFNFCYLVRREVVNRAGNIRALENQIMAKNPFIAKVLDEAEFLWDKPKVINNFNFLIKEPVFKGILMCGDASGLIVPLTGNGMALAIHQAKIAAELISTYGTENPEEILAAYRDNWKRNFQARYRFSRNVQLLFGRSITSKIGVWMGKNFTPIAEALMRRTHGQPF